MSRRKQLVESALRFEERAAWELEHGAPVSGSVVGLDMKELARERWAEATREYIRELEA